jgi:catechol 2,3-dioxygenase-like lactoylglutathione lyase family enzyme
LTRTINLPPIPPKAAVPTYGLTHIALSVRDPRRSFEFYKAVLGVVAVYEDDAFVQAQTPGSRDVLVFERGGRVGRKGGIAHFGFRLKRAADIELAIRSIRAAGGTITDTGEFIPGEPYVFFRDPDGYVVEIWYEIPTPADPRPSRKPRKQGTRGKTARRASA